MAKIIEVVEGDFRYKNYKDEAQKWLLKIEAINKRTKPGENVKLEDIENLIIQLQRKYGHKMQWITLTMIDGEKPWYSVSIKDGKTNDWVKTIYGITIYELYCKVALFLYAYTRKEDKRG